MSPLTRTTQGATTGKIREASVHSYQGDCRTFFPLVYLGVPVFFGGEADIYLR